MGGTLKIALVFAGFLALGLLYEAFHRWRHRAVLAAARALLEDGRIEDTGAVVGRLRGRSVRIDYTTRGEGSSSEAWTEVVAEHRLAELDLAVRPQGLIDAAIGAVARGVDVQVGDADFDRAFVVEGAPTAAVRAALPDTARAQLMSLRPVDLTSAHGRLTVGKKKWVPVRDVAVMLVVAEEIARAVDTIAPTGARTSAYRASDAESEAARAERQRELAALASARKRTERLRNSLVLAVVVTFMALWLASVFWPR